MAFGLTGKLVSGVLALTTTSVGGIALSNHLKPATIGEELYLESFNLIPDNSEEWKSLMEKYNTATGEDQTNIPKKIQDLKDTVDESKLKEKCKSLWNVKLTDTQTQENKSRIKDDLKNWCVNNSKALRK